MKGGRRHGSISGDGGSGQPHQAGAAFVEFLGGGDQLGAHIVKPLGLDHLDQHRRAALYDEICALGAQALMTGTEPGLFDSLGNRAQNITVAEEGGLSKVSET